MSAKRNNLTEIIRKSWMYVLIIILSCTPSKVVKKPAWLDGSLPSYHYRGIAINKSTAEEAINEARKDAVRSIMEEVGISIESEFERKRSEKDNEINIEFKDRLRAATKGWIRGVKERDNYTRKSEDGKVYDAWVLISIPSGEIERARKQIKEYEEEIIREASINFAKSEELEKEKDCENATIYYNSVVRLLKEIDTPESENLKTKALEKIKRIDDVAVRFMQLKGNTDIIEEAELIFYHDRTTAPPFLKTGDKVLLKMDLNGESYVYIISWDKETGQFRLLFPNRYERENLSPPGEILFPTQSGEEDNNVSFVAEPPKGWNYLKVIATSEPIEIPPFEKDPYILLSKSYLFDFIYELEKTSYDTEDIQFGVE